MIKNTKYTLFATIFVIPLKYCDIIILPNQNNNKTKAHRRN